MKNFAEEISYWYFRLNGFFLLENYVSHKSETNTASYADNDLIGIRPKNVTEIIGLNNPNDTCDTLKKIIDFDEKMVGIICEVKGGDSPTNKLNETKLNSCIKRLGLLYNDECINSATEILKTTSKFECKDVAIHKIFVSVSDSPIEYWDKIEIKVMIDFIKTRIQLYKEKGNAWNHYDSALFQYLLYEDKQKEVSS